MTVRSSVRRSHNTHPKKGLTAMYRLPRILYHTRVTLAHDGFGYIVDESHSYDMGDSVDAMMKEAQRIVSGKGYHATFNENTLSYIISRPDWTTYATIRLVSSDDGIDL